MKNIPSSILQLNNSLFAQHNLSGILPSKMQRESDIWVGWGWGQWKWILKRIFLERQIQPIILNFRILLQQNQETGRETQRALSKSINLFTNDLDMKSSSTTLWICYHARHGASTPLMNQLMQHMKSWFVHSPFMGHDYKISSPQENPDGPTTDHGTIRVEATSLIWR